MLLSLIVKIVYLEHNIKNSYQHCVVYFTFCINILCMRPANERRRYNVTSSLIGCAPAQINHLQGWVQIRFCKYKYKYKFSDFSNTNTNTMIFFFKYKYKYKYEHSNTNTNTLRFYSNTNNIQIQIRFFTLYTNINISPNFSKMRRNLKNYWKLHLTPKQLETHGCILSTVATDAQVLKHQAISTHNAD